MQSPTRTQQLIPRSERLYSCAVAHDFSTHVLLAVIKSETGHTKIRLRIKQKRLKKKLTKKQIIVVKLVTNQRLRKLKVKERKCFISLIGSRWQRKSLPTRNRPTWKMCWKSSVYTTVIICRLPLWFSWRSLLTLCIVPTSFLSPRVWITRKFLFSYLFSYKTSRELDSVYFRFYENELVTVSLAVFILLQRTVCSVW